jgi:DNA (cytosine-5)-methyltransferase 1
MKPVYRQVAEQIKLPLMAAFNQNFSFVDLFAGIGGFRIALEKLGGFCLGYSEIDCQAIRVYKNNFIGHLEKDEQELGDITKLTNLPSDIDILVGGIPCQPWSVAGLLQGFNDPRGKLWFDVFRLVKQSQPKSFIFENVSGLANPKNQANLALIIHNLEESGYCVKWKILNAYDFGLPQNRERIFIVGVRNDLKNHQEYSFPQPLNIHPKVLDILNWQYIKPVKKAKLEANTLFNNGFIPPSRTRFQKEDELNDFFIFSDLRNGHTTIHSWDLIKTTPREKLICLTHLKHRRSKKYGQKDGHPLDFVDLKEMITDLKLQELDKLVEKNIFLKTNDNKYEFINSKNSSGINGIYRIILPTADIIPTLTATGAKDYIATKVIEASHPEDYKKAFLSVIFKPKNYVEIDANLASKLQGFPTNFQYHEKQSTAKKQFGNAVPIPVVEYVAKELLKILEI